MFLIPEHQERYEHFLKPLYGMLLEISWLLRLLQYQFFPEELKPNVNYQIRAKFVGTGDRNYVVCDECYNLIRSEFPDLFANQ
ncbi:hypothetical protein GLN3_11245 [Geobacillus lituanicus]|nr:hypothetical protein GLN3_11245 [Geobacillus lituanicus]